MIGSNDELVSDADVVENGGRRGWRIRRGREPCTSLTHPYPDLRLGRENARRSMWAGSESVLRIRGTHPYTPGLPGAAETIFVARFARRDDPCSVDGGGCTIRSPKIW